RFPQIVAHRLRIAADRIRVRFGEKVRRHLVAHAFENLQFLARGHAGCGKLRTFEIAPNTLVLIGKELAVHLLEIEYEVEGAANAWILELVATNIEGESLHDADVADGEFLADDALFPHGRKIIRSRPVLGAVLDAPVDLVALECLECDGRVAKVLVAQGLEVARAD